MCYILFNQRNKFLSNGVQMFCEIRFKKQLIFGKDKGTNSTKSTKELTRILKFGMRVLDDVKGYIKTGFWKLRAKYKMVHRVETGYQAFEKIWNS